MPSLEPMVVRMDLSVSSVDAEAFLHEGGGGLAEGGDAFVEGVAVVFGIVDGLGHFIDDEFVGGEVGVADAEVDDVFAGGQEGAFFLVDLDEEVGREGLEALGFCERHFADSLV